MLWHAIGASAVADCGRAGTLNSFFNFDDPQFGQSTRSSPLTSSSNSLSHFWQRKS
jgi:hypothetical protein